MEFATSRQAAATRSSFRVVVKDLSGMWARSLQTWICPSERSSTVTMGGVGDFIYVMQALL